MSRHGRSAKETQKVNPLGTVTQFNLFRTLDYFCLCKLLQLLHVGYSERGCLSAGSEDAFTGGDDRGVGGFLEHLCFYFDIFLKWRVQLFIAHFKVTFESNM